MNDFPDPALGRAVPYGVHDVVASRGWAGGGIGSDTAAFAVETVRRWWQRMGRRLHPGAERLPITADGGGSSSSRSRLWELELQRLADGSGLKNSVCRFPLGTSKWNRIQHRMFCRITQNWGGGGRPSATRPSSAWSPRQRPKKGSRQRRASAEWNTHTRKASRSQDGAMESLSIRRARFHGDWNYTLDPRS